MGKCLVSCFFWLTVYIRTLDNMHNSQVQGLNLEHGRLLGGKKTVDVNDEQT